MTLERTLAHMSATLKTIDDYKEHRTAGDVVEDARPSSTLDS